MIHFQYPYLLLLLLPLFAIAFWLARRGRPAAIAHSSVELVRAVARSRRSRWGRFLTSLRWLGAALLVLAMARPNRTTHHAEVQASGIDIMLALDVSGSMQAQDMQGEDSAHPASRIQAAKQVVSKFVSRRPNDRIGVVAFAGEPYLVSPLTLDHDWVRQSLERLGDSDVSDGTAIGSALAVGASRLDTQQAKSRVLVLLTDGQNNAGNVEPSAAAEAARALGVKVYTIGVGSTGEALVPVSDDNGQQHLVARHVDIDEATLKNVAEATGGMYFRATDERSLEQVYGTIDQLEKTTRTFKQHSKKQEQFAWFAVPGLLAILAELGLSATRFLRIPG